jgi:hypothetical protein
MSKEIELRFDKTRKSQAGVADLFAMMLGKEPPPKCAECGGIKKKDAEGHTVVGRAQCICADGGWE